MLPAMKKKEKGGAGDHEAHGDYDSLHYSVWADYANVIQESLEMQKNQQKSGVCTCLILRPMFD